MKTICFIPVRKGSKGIPGKNMKELGGKPLICWVLDTTLNAGIADEIWVATDCDNMETMLNERYGAAIKVFRRSAWSARDEAPTMEVVQEFISICHPDDSDRFILLQATSPFTTAEELHTLHQEMIKKEYDSFIACCRLKKFHWSEDGQPLDYTFQTKPRRQEYKGLLIETGAFYASTVGQILHSSQLLSDSIKTIEIGVTGMIDIDEEEDWKAAEYYIECHKPEL